MNFRLLLAPFLLGFLLFLQGCAGTGSHGYTTFTDLGNGIFQVPGSELMWQKERSPLFTSKEEAVRDGIVCRTAWRRYKVESHHVYAASLINDPA